MISNEEAESALEFLRDNSDALGKAKSTLLEAENWLARVEAMEYVASNEKTVEAKKMAVRLTERYQEAEAKLVTAAGEWEKLKALQDAARHVVAIYQTQSANERQFAEAAHRGVRDAGITRAKASPSRLGRMD